MTEVERLAEGIRRADQAGDAEAVRVLGARYRQLQQTQPVAAPETAPGVKTRVPVVTGEIGGPPVSSPPPEPDPGRQLLQTVLAGPTLAIARDPVQYSRNLAGEAAAAGATGLGIALGAPGGIPGMMVGGAVGASAGARAKQLIKGEPEPSSLDKATETGLGAVSAAAGGVVGKLWQKWRGPKAPTVEQVKTQATALYDRARQEGVRISASSWSNTVDDLEKVAAPAMKHKRHYRETSALLKDLRRTVGGEIDFEDVDLMRQMARDLRTSQKESEQRLGALLVQKIDDYLDSLTASDVVAGDPMRAAATIHEARKVWGQFRKGEIIGDTLHKAELRASQFSQSGPENAIRTEFRQLARNDKLMRGFSKQERAAIERVAKGEPVVNVMRFLGKFAPHGVVSTALSGGAGYTVGGPGGAAATMAAGEAAHRAAGAVTAGRARAVQDMALRGAPLPSGKAPAAGAFALSAGQQMYREER